MDNVYILDNLAKSELKKKEQDFRFDKMEREMFKCMIGREA
jgi:hypothetical protein